MQSIKLVIAMLLVTSQFAFAQVKKQFQDDANKKTTVVVKEDAVNDYDILNNQFNIGDVGMGTVIRIDTEKELPAPAPEEMVADNSGEIQVQTSTINLNEPTPKVVTQNTNEAVDRASEPVEKKVVKKATRSTSSSASKGTGKRVSVSKKFKVKKNKRKRSKKRKRFKSCYRF